MRGLCLSQMEGPGLFSSSCGVGAGVGLDCLLGDVFGCSKAKQWNAPAEKKTVVSGVFMLHRFHSVKRTSPYRLSMVQTIPLCPKDPFALSITAILSAISE